MKVCDIMVKQRVNGRSGFPARQQKVSENCKTVQLFDYSTKKGDTNDNDTSKTRY